MLQSSQPLAMRNTTL